MVDEDDTGMHDEPSALLMIDRGTDYADVFPLEAKTAAECYRVFMAFAGPHDYINELFTDNAPELIKGSGGCAVDHLYLLARAPNDDRKDHTDKSVVPDHD